MRAVDTNVLVRLMTRDNQRQAASADSFVMRGAWVSVLALAEAIWVLAKVYNLASAELAAGIEMLLNHNHLSRIPMPWPKHWHSTEPRRLPVFPTV